MPEGDLARGAHGLVAGWAGQSGVLVLQPPGFLGTYPPLATWALITVTDNPKFCIGTALSGINTPSILLPFSSILYHLGKRVVSFYSMYLNPSLWLFLKSNANKLRGIHISIPL